MPENAIRYVPQGAALVPSVSSVKEHIRKHTIIPSSDCLASQDNIRYTLYDLSLVSMYSNITNRSSSIDMVSPISNNFRPNVYPMQTRSKTRSMTTLTTSFQPQDDLDHSAPNDIYNAM